MEYQTPAAEERRQEERKRREKVIRMMALEEEQSGGCCLTSPLRSDGLRRLQKPLERHYWSCALVQRKVPFARLSHFAVSLLMLDSAVMSLVLAWREPRDGTQIGRAHV